LKTKLLSVFLLLLIILSNVSFSLINLSSFLSEKNIYDSSTAINIQQQYNMLVSIPKDFIDMCVKVQNDFKILKTNNEVNLFFNKNVRYFNNNVLAILASPLKLRISYLYTKVTAIEKVIEYSNNIFVLFSLIFIFYILRYVGLLKLFSSYDYINKTYKGFYYSV
jgi:hypothetical protein